MMWGNDSWSTNDAAMMAMMVVGLLVTAALVVWVVRGLADSDRHPRLAGGRWPSRPSAYEAAEQVLARRFAAGEIDEAQLDRARAALHRDRSVDPRG